MDEQTYSNTTLVKVKFTLLISCRASAAFKYNTC